MLVLHSIEYTFPMSLHPLAFMFHQHIVSQLMQESLSYDSDMGQYLHFCSPYGDLQNIVTIVHLPHLLLHRLCFAHIKRTSCNHYFLLLLRTYWFCCASFTLESFQQRFSYLLKFAGIPLVCLNVLNICLVWFWDGQIPFVCFDFYCCCVAKSLTCIGYVAS